MRKFTFTTFCKKKIAPLFGVMLTTVMCLTPVSVKADSPTTPTYTATNPENLIGVAADFGIFVRGTARMTAHSDSNFACGILDLDQRNITPRSEDAINYAGKVIRNGFLDKGYLFVGDGEVIKPHTTYNDQYWRVGQYIVAEESKVKGVISAPNYIDLESEFKKLETIASDLATSSNRNTTYDNIDWNRLSITCSGDYNVINLKANEFTGNDLNLNIKGLRADKLLIINVDMSSVKTDIFNFQRRIMLDGVMDAFDQDATNVILNFNNYAGTIHTTVQTAGVILAPKAKVIVGGGNHIGIVIANEFSNNSEVHYVPYTEVKSLTVGIQSVDGDCCPSKPLGGVTFAIYTTSGSLIAGTEKQVVKNADGTYTADWQLATPGKYYIQETVTTQGYAKTPIKARFDIVEENGKLKLNMITGKEANGYSDTIRDGRFLIRHYSNEVFAVALDASTFELQTGVEYELYTSNDNATDLTLGGLIARGTPDEKGFFTAYIPEAGYYCMVQTKEGVITTKKFAVYRTPIGHQLVIELDHPAGIEVLNLLKSHLGDTMQMKKLTVQMNKALITYGYKDGVKTNTYEAVTDTCVIFLNN